MTVTVALKPIQIEQIVLLYDYHAAYSFFNGCDCCISKGLRGSKGVRGRVCVCVCMCVCVCL